MGYTVQTSGGTYTYMNQEVNRPPPQRALFPLLSEGRFFSDCA